MGLEAVYSKIALLFILIISGYVLSKVKALTETMVESLTTFVLSIATPAIIISGMMIQRTPEKLKEGIILVVISSTVCMVSLIVAKLVTKLMDLSYPKEGIFQYALIFSNVSFMGLPVIATLFGNEGIFYAAMYNIPFNILTYTLGVSLVSREDSDNKLSIKSFLRPGAAAAILGFIIFALAIPVPTLIKEALTLVGSTTTPVSMLMIGAMLASIPLNKMFNDWHIYIVSAIRLFVIPLTIFVVLRFVFNIDNIMLVGIPVIISGMPVAANAALITQEYGDDPEIASQCVFTSTLISIISIPLLSLLFI